jgi:RNA polymerase sigma factor (sigma-70 family)
MARKTDARSGKGSRKPRKDAVPQPETPDDQEQDDEFSSLTEELDALEGALETEERVEDAEEGPHDEGEGTAPSDSFQHYLQALKAHAILISPEEQFALARNCANGDAQAGRMLVRSVILLAVKTGMRYHGRGVPAYDLIQSALLGAILALPPKYDPDRGVKFGVYAMFWIRACIFVTFIQRSDIRIPTKLASQVTKLRELLQRTFETDGTRDIDAALLEVAGNAKGAALLHRANCIGVTSFDAPTRDDDDATLYEMFADPSSENPEEEAIRRDLFRRCRKLLKTNAFTRPERKIIMARLFKAVPPALEEIGKELGFTRERARQLEARALKKLRDRLSPPDDDP